MRKNCSKVCKNVKKQPIFCRFSMAPQYPECVFGPQTPISLKNHHKIPRNHPRNPLFYFIFSMVLSVFLIEISSDYGVECDCLAGQKNINEVRTNKAPAKAKIIRLFGSLHLTSHLGTVGSVVSWSDCFAKAFLAAANCSAVAFG